MSFAPLAAELSPFGRPVRAVASIAIIGIPVLVGLQHLEGLAFRDHLDVYTTELTTPLEFTMPLVAVLLFCLGTSHEVGHRYLASTRTRLDPRVYVTQKFGGVIVSAFAVFFLFAFVPYILSLSLWPALGDPGIDPAGYNLTPEEIYADSLERFSYSQLLAHGPWFFGIAYSAWIGLVGATYAVMGVAFLLLIKSRFLGLILPFLITFVETLIAALLGFPQAGLVYSIFPFGLVQIPIIPAASPVLALVVLVSALAIHSVRRARDLETLS